MRGDLRSKLKFIFFLRYIIVLSITGSALRAYSNEELRIFANNYLYYGHNSILAEKQVFEDWASFTLGYSDFELNVGYEVHLPPPVWSYQNEGHGIYDFSFSYKNKDLKVTAGTFNTLLGKGITYRSFSIRDLRYFTNIGGVQIQYSNKLLDLNVFGGRPSDFEGNRMPVLKGGEIRVSPVNWGFLGLTYATTNTGIRESQWGSAYTQVQGDWGNLYTEFASRDFFSKDSSIKNKGNLFNGQGTAFYGVSNFFLFDLTMLFEAAYYNEFDISEGVKVLNSPPPSIKEHTFTFMSRHIPTLNANNHASLHAEFTYALSDENNIALILSRARAKKENEQGGITAWTRCINIVNDSADYSDIFLKGELIFPQNIDWVMGAGFQKSIQYRNVNFAATNDIGLRHNFSAQLTFEHQHSTVLSTNQKYFSQFYGLTLSRSESPRASVAFMLEYTSEQKLKKNVWPGFQVNWSFYENSDISIFVGERKKGKSCIGGVCIFKPEFSGVEVTLTTKF